MKYSPVDNALYQNNRMKFLSQMSSSSLAIFSNNAFVIENGDATYAYRPNSNMIWLTGIEQDESSIILFQNKDTVGQHEVLIIKRPDITKEKWTGHFLTKEEASDISGIKSVYFTDEFNALFPLWMSRVEKVYLYNNEHDRRPLDAFDANNEFVQNIKSQYPNHLYLRSAPILKVLRAYKSKNEIELVQKAIDITGIAFEQVMKKLKPGIFEYEIEGEISGAFLKNGATRPAYSSIVATGRNACILHYIENNKMCEDGDLLLLDFGAEYAYYCADMSRTLPVNGKFSKRQKEVYNAVYHVFNYATSILKPSVRYEDYAALVNTEIEKQCIKLGLISKSDIKNQDPSNPAFRKYFYHGIGHHLGIDVHDMGSHFGNVEAGMLFTIEPGIYIEEENLGVRIENNFWLTENGNEDLFKNIPITIEEIEAFMKVK